MTGTSPGHADITIPGLTIVPRAGVLGDTIISLVFENGGDGKG